MKKRPASRRRQNRPLVLERLETRVVLDGGIRAFVSGGSLHIQGDSHANQITIEQSAHGSFTISSRDGSTQINGQSSPRTFSGVRKDLDISMGSGADVVDLDGGDGGALIVHNRLFMALGTGADQVLMENVHVLRLHIDTGSGDDTINVGNDAATSGLMVTKEAVVLTGSGKDDARVANSIFKRFLNLNMGNNNDETTMQSVSVRRRSVIHGGSGNDTLHRQDNQGKLKFLSYEHADNNVQSPAPIPPVAVNDSATVTRGQSATINVATNDTSATSTIDPASIVITQAPAHGTAVANSTGTVTYTNNGDTAASDTFQYTIDDQDGTTSNAATVTITVNAPTGITAVGDSASITEDATPNTVSIANVIANDTNATGATVTAVNGTPGNVGQAVPGAAGHGTFLVTSAGQVTYTLNNADAAVNALNNGQPLTDTATYTITAGGNSSTATITITINGHTDTALNAVDDPFAITEDATPNTITGVNITTNDTNAAGNKTVTAVNGVAGNVGADVQGAHGTFHINTDGTLTYTLNNADAAVNALNDGQTLTDTMPYTVNDGTTSSTAQVRITIQGHTDSTALTAVGDSTSITEDATPNTVSIANVIANDTNATGATVTAVNGTPGNVGQAVPGAAGHGTFLVTSAGQVTYTLNNADAAVNALNNGQPLTDTATYTITAGGNSSTATITITINGHTDTALNAVDDPFSITEDATPNTITGVNVTTNDTNAAGNKTVTAVNGVAGNVGADVQGAHGTFHINTDGALTYTLNNADTAVNALNNGQTLTDTMPYSVNDGTTSSTAQVRITIQGHTDTALNAVDDPFSITEDATPNTITGVNVTTNDTNAAGNKTVTAVNGVAGNVGADVQGAHGTFHINTDGTLTYTLNNADAAVNALNDGQTLIDTMPYSVNDGTTTSTATVRITIQGHTDTALNAVDDAFSITEDATPNTITGNNVLTNDTNAAGNKTVTAVDGAAGNVGVNFTGQFGTFNIASNGSFTYTLDNTNATVNALNDGQSLIDSVPYTVSDGTTTSTARLRITIQGHTDP